MRYCYFIICLFIFFTNQSNAVYQQRAYIKVESLADAHFFGSTVATSGDTMVVGGQQHDEVYVYIRVAGLWQYQATLTADNLINSDRFGNDSIDIDGDTIVIGARSEDATGAVFVYVRSGTTWTQQTKLIASNAETGDEFGHSVAISGNRVVVGAYREDSNSIANEADNSLNNAGAVYVFSRAAGVWVQDAYLKSNNPQAFDIFGVDVAIDGSNIVIGAPGESSGGVYLFSYNAGSWFQTDRTMASNPYSNSNFGNAVAIDGDKVIVGSNFESSDGAGNVSAVTSASGAAYIYQISTGSLVEQAYLKAANINTDDEFGEDVGIYGDTVVIGVEREDSNSTGIDGVYNELAAQSGAVYIYTSIAGVWTQKHYIKASNTGAGDFFGANVAIGNAGVVVGAHFEASNATGINADGNNDLRPLAGAVYVFDQENFAPITVDNEYQVFTNTTLTVAVENSILLDDVDPEGQTLSVANAGTFTLSPLGGSLTINTDGSFIYNSPTSATGTDLHNFNVTDGVNSSPSTLSLVVSANSPPTAVNDDVTVDEDNSIGINVLDNDISNSSPTVIVNLFSQPGNGTVTNSASVLTYQPNENYCNDGGSVDEFTYELNGGSIATVTVSVTCIDDAPVAVTDSYSVNEDNNIIMNVLDNDTDVDGGPMLITFITPVFPASSGSMTYSDSSITYMPSANYCSYTGLNTSIFYRLNNIPSVSTQARVLVNCVNDKPSFTIAGDIDISANAATPIIVSDFASNFIFGPDSASENAQTVENFVVTIIADSDNIIDTIDISNTGELSITPTNSFGLAIVSVALVDDGGTDFGGNNTSDAIEFIIDNLGDNIFVNGFESPLLKTLIEKQSTVSQDELLVIRDNMISFMGHDLYLDSYDAQHHGYILQKWLEEVMLIDDELN